MSPFSAKPSSFRSTILLTMFTIVQCPLISPYLPTDDKEFDRHALPDAMDLDEANLGLGEGPSGLHRTVVSPGEMITSSKEFMRSVSFSMKVIPPFL